MTRLGLEINNPESIYYWAAKNNIPVFSPALTDGSLGDMMFFHSYKNPGLVVDIVSGGSFFQLNHSLSCCFDILSVSCLKHYVLIPLDLRRLNSMALKAVHSGMIIIGGGVVKHHICNANLMVSVVK